MRTSDPAGWAPGGPHDRRPDRHRHRRCSAVGTCRTPNRRRPPSRRPCRRRTSAMPPCRVLPRRRPANRTRWRTPGTSSSRLRSTSAWSAPGRRWERPPAGAGGARCGRPPTRRDRPARGFCDARRPAVRLGRLPGHTGRSGRTDRPPVCERRRHVHPDRPGQPVRRDTFVASGLVGVDDRRVAPLFASIGIDDDRPTLVDDRPTFLDASQLDGFSRILARRTDGDLLDAWRYPTDVSETTYADPADTELYVRIVVSPRDDELQVLSRLLVGPVRLFPDSSSLPAGFEEDVVLGLSPDGLDPTVKARWNDWRGHHHRRLEPPARRAARAAAGAASRGHDGGLAGGAARGRGSPGRAVHRRGHHRRGPGPTRLFAVPGEIGGSSWTATFDAPGNGPLADIDGQLVGYLPISTSAGFPAIMTMSNAELTIATATVPVRARRHA